MNIEKSLPVTLHSHQSDVDPYVYYARGGGSDTLQLIQFGMHSTPPLYSFGPGVRDHHLIHFVFSGRGDVALAGRRFHVEGGQLFLIPAGSVSYYQADELAPWRYAWIGFDGTWGQAVLDAVGLDGAHPLADMRDMSRMYGIVSEMHQAMFEPNGYLLLCSGALRLMDQLLSGPRAQAVTGNESRQDPGSLRRDSRIDDLILRLDQHYLESLSVQALSEELQMSRSYLSEQFRKRAGCSIKTYVTRLRMKHACMRMIDHRLTIRSVAEECGYDDPLFFSRVFKKHYGMSPRQYQESVWKEGGAQAAPGAPVREEGPGTGQE